MLIDDFICENEKGSTLKMTFFENNSIKGPFVDTEMNFDIQQKYCSASSTKVYELDSAQWHDSSKIKIQVSNNNSDYNNGFMSKRNILLLSPVFLIPKKVFDDSKVMETILERSCNSKGKIPGQVKDYVMDPTAPMERVHWPGYTRCGDFNIAVPNFLMAGGDTEFIFHIRKKHKIHFISLLENNKNGYFHIDDFTMAWYQWIKKYKFYFHGVQQSNIEENKVIRSGYIDQNAQLKNSNEDQ